MGWSEETSVKMSEQRVTDDRTRGTGAVQPCSQVRLEDEDGVEELAIVPPEDADASAGRVSMDSPIGRALLGRVPGEHVQVSTPGGVRALSILAVLAIPC
jgi:transcription elongation GreA/GreB family factor